VSGKVGASPEVARVFTLRIAGIDVKASALPKHESRVTSALKAYAVLERPRD
jgi:hypothetical protein